jgi:hypothetical protein
MQQEERESFIVSGFINYILQELKKLRIKYRSAIHEEHAEFMPNFTRKISRNKPLGTLRHRLRMTLKKEYGMKGNDVVIE